MNQNMKLWLILATVFVVIGAGMIVTVLSIYGWDFTLLNTVPYETNTHSPAGEFHSISLDTSTADIVILPSEDGACRVVCHEQENTPHHVEILEGILTVTEEDNREFYQQIGISFGTPQLTFYLPDTQYQDLTIRCSTANIEIPDGFHFENIDLKLTTGNVENYASVSNTVKIKTTTGRVYMEKVTADVFDITVSTGLVEMNGCSCNNLISAGNTGDLILEDTTARESLHIQRSTGDVTFINADAEEIFVKTSTGNVSGNLTSEKVFSVQTSSGDADVPKSQSGGICEVHTSTGDIKITVADDAS